MKNTKIVHAWDTVTPTAAQKRRMRAALEAQLTTDKTPFKAPKTDESDILDFTLPGPAPEKTGKHPPKPRPKYQAVQPKKKRGSAFAAVAALLAVVIAGGLFLGVMSGDPGSNPGFAAPEKTAPTTAATEATRPAELPQGYQDVISKYVTAIEEGWNPEKCMNADISILTANAQSTEDLGYALMDLDEDGEAELLITDGSLIYDLYTMNAQREACCVASSMERDRFYLCEDSIIAEEGSSGAAASAYHFSKLSGTSLNLIDAVIYSASYDPENPWFRGENEEHITEEQANAIIDAYPHRYISYLPLSGEGNAPEGKVPEEAVLNQYAQQLPTLVSGDMSEQCQLYCFYDYDNDGEAELLLGSGKSVYMVLEADPGKADSTPFFAGGSGAAYPCEDHVMEYTGYGQGYTHFSYRKYGGENDGGALDYVYRDEENWYTMDENGDSVSISEAEAEAIRGKYKRLNLPWKNLSEFPVTIPESSGERISALFDDCFLPIAEEGKLLTQDELENRLAEKGFLGEEGEGLITWTDSEIPEAYLRVPVADASGYVHGPLTYSLPGVVGRYVAVLWDENGNVQYWKEADTYRNTYAVDSPEELTAFLNLSDENLLAMDAAETFAEKYFAGEASKQREEWNKDSENKIHSWDYSYDISEIRGYEDAGAAYETNGYAEITAAAYVDSPDSYTYLTMRLEKENGAWTVTDSWLEK